MPTLRPLLAAAPEPRAPFHARLLAYPILLALLGILIAAIAITTGQDYRREHALLQLKYDRAHLANALAAAQRENADPQNATTPKDLAPLITALEKANASDIPSYAKYGRQFTPWDGYRYERNRRARLPSTTSPAIPPTSKTATASAPPRLARQTRQKCTSGTPSTPVTRLARLPHPPHISPPTIRPHLCLLDLLHSLAAIVTFIYARRHFFNPHLPRQPTAA